jgi:Na+-driven multidrug efflux pump
MEQIAAFCCGILFCTWFLGATSEQVALIRFPAYLFLVGYVIANMVKATRQWWRVRRHHVRQ